MAKNRVPEQDGQQAQTDRTEERGWTGGSANETGRDGRPGRPGMDQQSDPRPGKDARTERPELPGGPAGLGGPEKDGQPERTGKDMRMVQPELAGKPVQSGKDARTEQPDRTGKAAGRALPRHLLVLRTSAMGDVAMLPHALLALKAAYPDLRITVATQPQFRPFFGGLDVEFLDVNTKGAEHSLAGMWRLAREARRRGVDAVADVHGVMRSEAFSLSMRLHGVPVAAIDKGRREKRRFIREGGRRAEPLRHTVLRYCDVFRRLGFACDDPRPAVPRERPNPFGTKHGVWVGFAPFSAHPGKTYPAEQRREVVRLLAGRYERVFIHSGGGAEAAFAEEMERTYPNVTALWGKVRFEGEMDLLSHLDCVVAMDSLVMHLASLVATPVVSVWGATHPGLGFAGWGCDSQLVLQADLACRPCSVYGAKPCRYGDYRCLRAVTPEMIAAKVAGAVGR